MGKVHGGLTKVGKVRTQTPKVEKKSDAPKPVTGRAKKRKQYERRVANGTLDVSNQESQ